MTDTNVYTDAMVAELRSLSPVDNEKAIAFAEKHGLSVQSVRAKAVRTDGIEYVKKPRVSKNGSPVESKAEIVSQIAASLGASADSFESLENATKLVLQKIRDALA